MGSLLLLTLLFGQTAPAASAAPLPEGCEKRCEKKHVPCRDGRAEDQMMCFEVVRRCEVRCDKARAEALRTPQK